MVKVRCISLNVNGLNNAIKRKRILQYLKKEGGEVIFLQETHLSTIEHAKMEKLANAQVFHSSHSTSKRGVSILIKNHLMFKKIKCIRDKEGRYVVVIGMLEEQCLTLINVYNPPGKGDGLVEKVLQLLMMEAQGTVIMAGDLNLVMNPKLDTQSRKKHKSEKAADLLRKAETDIGLTDVWRCLHPCDKAFTYYSDAHKVFSRLDYFFMYKNDIGRVSKCEILPITITDHAPVVMEMNMNVDKGETLWRLNNSLLGNPHLKDKIARKIKSFFELNDNGEVSDIVLWEAAKATIRGEIIALSSWEKKQKEKTKTLLEKKVGDLQKEYEICMKAEVYTQLCATKKLLKSLELMEIEKKLVLCKQTHFENSTTSLKKLAFKLKKQQERSIVATVKDKRGVYRRGKSNIASGFREFYQDLYTPELEVDNKEIKTFLDTLQLPAVTDGQNEELTRPITEIEIAKTIKNGKAGRSPGDDGYTYEFYKEFSRLLIPILCRVFNRILETGVWPNTWNSAIISVLYKEGKDPECCSSYRPISLLNVDQKVFTAIIAKRMSNIMPKIINLDQTGFVKDRLLSDNIHRTINVIDYASKNKLSMLTITLDAEKAFDRLFWPFLIEVCKKFKFNQTFVNLIRGMYATPQARVKVNGTLSDSFTIKRGTKQGDPLSPQLFALCIEPLAERIRQNTEVRGVYVGKEEHKIALFADDIILYLTSVYKSLPTLMCEITSYSNVSGYKLNLNKTEVMQIGCQLDNQFKTAYNFKWDQNSIKYLGVIVPNNLEQLYQSNFGTLEKSVKQDLNRWRSLPFTLMEKISAIKMNILPRFLFLFQNIPLYIPHISFKYWESLLRKFLWDGKKPRVKLKILQQRRREGGLALPNLINYYYAAQVKLILIMLNKGLGPKWKNMETILVGNLNKLFTTKQMKTNNFVLNNTVKTWRKICKNIKIKEGHLTCLREIQSDPDFTPNTLDNTFKSWGNKGLVMHSQMFSDIGVETFENIARAYQLQNNQFYRYLQLRNYLNEKAHLKSLTDLHILIQYMAKKCQSENTKHLTGQIYNILQECGAEKLDHIKEKWELDLNKTISEEEWNQCLEHINVYTRSPYWQEYAWKMTIRYFLTPSIMAKYAQTNTSCWRECGVNNADYTHIFYSCNKLNKYWQAVQHLMREKLSKDVSIQNHNAILGIRPRGLEKEHLHLFWVFRITALKQITRNWKKVEPPTTDMWLESIEEMRSMEKITYRINNKENVYDKKWSLYKS